MKGEKEIKIKGWVLGFISMILLLILLWLMLK